MWNLKSKSDPDETANSGNFLACMLSQRRMRWRLKKGKSKYRTKDKWCFTAVLKIRQILAGCARRASGAVLQRNKSTDLGHPMILEKPK
jgi:hypothetical protein